MKLCYDPERFEFQDGRYPAIFAGLAPHDNKGKKGADGNEMGPAVRWGFKLIDGPDAGKVCGKITPEHPTQKNACGRMIMGMLERPLDKNYPFDSDTYVGSFFMISIVEGKVADTPAPRFIGSKEMKPSDIAAVLSGQTQPGKRPDKPAGTTDPIPFF